MSRRVGAAVGVLLGVVLAGCGGDDPASSPSVSATTSTPTPTPTLDTFTVSGEIAISMYDSFVIGGVLSADQGDSCSGDGGYDDISSGTQVIVRSDGRTVAVGELRPGLIRIEGSDCWFGFTIPDVPGEFDFYSVEVSHRGELTYDRQEIEDPLKLTLG